MNILELYSGIGGMHMALNESGILGKVVAAVEISTVANDVYNHNFPKTLLLNRNIQGLKAKFINKLRTDAIFMSPPCQPFTRNGLRRDEQDARSCSFSHILSLLPDLQVEYLLIENVKGFETSAMHIKLIDTLKECNFNYQEFIISPTQIGIANTRHRYYCIAKKSPLKFKFEVGDLKEEFPDKCQTTELFSLDDIIEKNEPVGEYLLTDKILWRRAMLLDICNPISKRSCCFTKSYGKYVEGTGSVYTPKSQDEIDTCYKELQDLTTDKEKYIDRAKKLELRFFTPKEVARLMSFPENFTFPNNLTLHQKYKLLGNSINVKVVAKLIQLLVEN